MLCKAYNVLHKYYHFKECIQSNRITLYMMLVKHSLDWHSISTRTSSAFRTVSSRARHRIACSSSSASSSYSKIMPMKHVNVGNMNDLEKKKLAFKVGGSPKLQVIADFDMTLTKYLVDGKRGQSSHSLVKQENAEFDRKRQELFDYYHPLEICPTIPVDKKTKLMEEWWERTHTLLIEGGLTCTAIKNSVKESAIEFRDGVAELFEILESKGVPVIIFSAGLADIIEEVMQQKLKRRFKNIKVVSNRMVFDDGGNLVRFQGKTIHVLNKNEHALEMAVPVCDNNNDKEISSENVISLVKNRTNILLLGDHLGDLGMSDGFNYDNRISVAFLNDNVKEWMETYKQAFDIVLTGDTSMSEVVLLVEEILK